MSEWTKFSEELPPVRREILICGIGSGGPKVGYYTGDDVLIYGNYETYQGDFMGYSYISSKYACWMPLPEPPEDY